MLLFKDIAYSFKIPNISFSTVLIVYIYFVINEIGVFFNFIVKLYNV